MKFQHFYRICLITAGTLILYGCMDSGEKSFSKELDKAMDVSTDSLDLRKYPKIDTLLQTEIPFWGQNGQDVCYIADTHCSICMNTAIKFVESFLESKNKGHLTILVKGDIYLFRYYLQEHNIPVEKVYLIEYPDGAENGAYIVWKGRVVRFFAETEIHQYFLKGK